MGDNIGQSEVLDYLRLINDWSSVSDISSADGMPNKPNVSRSVNILFLNGDIIRKQGIMKVNYVSNNRHTKYDRKIWLYKIK